MSADRQESLFTENAEYEAFVDKFKPKLTTDDCYTPPIVYEAVLNWCKKEYGIENANILRPFYPGGDYQSFCYPAGSVVVDNPPFSILVKIIRFYCSKNIPFFLFAPALTVFIAPECEVCYLATGVAITYENGARVRTSFVTNLDSMRVRSAPDLYSIVDAANTENENRTKAAPLPKYQYPKEVITAALVQKWSHYGIEFNVAADEAIYIPALDAQREQKKTIFGGGFLLKKSAAAAAASAAAAAAAKTEGVKEWQLSEREISMVEGTSAQPLSGQVSLFAGMEDT